MTIDFDAVLGIDLGTSMVKAGIYTLDGAVHAIASRPIALKHPADGRAEQDMDDFYEAAASATQECLVKDGFDRGRIGAMAVAGQMAGVGLVDSRHRPLAPFDSWLDTRCSGIVDDMTSKAGDRITAVSGCAPTISIGPKMLWWQRHEPELCSEAAAFVTAAGYVAGRAAGLRGRDAFIDPSHLHFTAIGDIGRSRWDETLADTFGLDQRLLPRIVESTSVVGELTPQAARDFGLTAGVPIAAGCGDTAAGALGSGVTEPTQAFDIAGTAAVFGVCSADFTPDLEHRTLMTMRAAVPGRWFSLAYVGGAGQVIEWMCREILGHPRLGDAAYAELAKVASAATPGCGGLMMSPHFAGRVAPVESAMRGSFLGLSPRHGRAELARAMLESIAFEYRQYADIARGMAAHWKVQEIIGTGGGSRMGVWNQIKADVLQLPYRPLVGVESGTRGAALVAIASRGHEIPELPASDYGAAATPNPANFPVYCPAYDRYRRWTDDLAQGYRQRSAPSK
jgi:xylulokinase